MKNHIVLFLAITALPLLGAPTCGVAPKIPTVEEIPQTIPYLGCSEPALIRPGDEEVGDFLVKQYPELSGEDKTLGVQVVISDKLICPAGAIGELCKDKAGQWVTLPHAELAPFEVLLWLGTANKYPVSTAMRVVVTPDRWGLYYVPMPNAVWGPVSVAYKFNGRGTGAEFRGTPINMCRSVVLAEGREYWCHDSDHTSAPRYCEDMSWGGDSPQPNFVGRPAGIWIYGEGPSFILNEVSYLETKGAFFLSEDGDW